MAERSLFWDGEVLGDCGPYDQSHLHDIFFRVLLNGTDDRGVLRNWLNELEVSGTASPLTVNTGAAICYGLFYQTDASVSVTIPTPASGTRTDLIVVRRDWTAQTCRIARIPGPGAALAQTQYVQWDIPLASVEIDAAGQVTITDTRDMVQYSTDWPINTVDTEHYAEGAVTPDKVPDRYRWELKDSGSLEPDSTNAPTWTAGAAYDYWEFADAVTDSGWVFFLKPVGVVSYDISVYVWSIPDVNGAGGGAENCEWDYNVYYGLNGSTLSSTSGTATVDQQARVNTTVYRDQLVDLTGQSIPDGAIILVKVSRDGAADSYNSDMRLIGVELYWDADA
jgi:hypothetical protein